MFGPISALYVAALIFAATVSCSSGDAGFGESCDSELDCKSDLCHTKNICVEKCTANSDCGCTTVPCDRYCTAYSDGSVCMPGCENGKSCPGSTSCSDEQIEGVPVKICL